MIDTHAHLNFSQLLNQVDEIVTKSKKAGVTGIIVASSSIEESKIAVDLSKKYKGFLFATVGIHPQKTDVENKDSISEQLKQLDKLVKENRKYVVSIGECGFDFSLPPPGEEERSEKEQEELLLGQIKIVTKHNLPLSLHIRDAYDKALEFLEENGHKDLKGVFHCYAGGRKRIQKILDLPGTWYFGVDGNLTYDPGLQSVVGNIPKDRLLLETDSPFLAPVPHRGETCTPEYLPLIAKTLAEIWQQDLEKVKEITIKNTKALFF